VPDKSWTTHLQGKWAESLASAYLQKKGLAPIISNYHGCGGEIDLIMREQDTIVFIEVRYRSSQMFMDAIETIDANKCARIINASQHYLQSRRGDDEKNCRFDVVTITGTTDRYEIRWIKNAFEA
jgi:TIGR00252 family protein